MFGISNKLVLIQFVVLLTFGALGYAYYTHSQKIIAQLHEDNTKLVAAVKSQEDAIIAQTEHAKKQNLENLALQQRLFDAENQRRDLEIKLRRKNLEAMARANSADLERKMNAATDRAFREIENLTRSFDKNHADTKPMPLETPPSNVQPPPRPPRQYPTGGPK